MPLITTADAKGLLDQLVEETLVEEYDTGAEGKTINDITDDLLALQVKANPIAKGTISPTETRAIRIPAGDSLLRAFLRLRDSVGGFIYVDTDRKLQWPTTLGQDVGQQIRYRKNLLGISRTTNYTKLINKLYPYGAGEVGVRVALDDLLIEDEEATKSSDASYGYLTLGGLYQCYGAWTGEGDALPDEMIIYEDAGDVSADWVQGVDEQTLRCDIGDYNAGATYTITYRHALYLWDGTAEPVVKQRSDRSILHPETLLAWGKLVVTDYKDPYYTYRIQTIDLSQSYEHDFSFEALQLGSVVNVIDEDLGINVATTIVRIKHLDLLHPERMDVELANKSTTIADILAEVYDAQQLRDHVATVIGAGQVIVRGVFTVLGWASDGLTTINGGEITADTVSLNALTASGDCQSDNYVADEAGWKIDAATGSAEFHNVKIRGTLYTSSIVAGNTLTVSGTISAASGAVIINDSGISIIGQFLTLKAGATHAEIYQDVTFGLRLQGPTVSLYPDTGGHVTIRSGSHLLPMGTSSDCGATTHPWGEGFFQYIQLKEVAAEEEHIGWGTLYTKNDNKLYFIDGDGNTHEVDFV